MITRISATAVVASFYLTAAFCPLPSQADTATNTLMNSSPNMMDWGVHMLEHHMSFVLMNSDQPHPANYVYVSYLPNRDTILIRATIQTASEEDLIKACSNFYWAVRATAGIDPIDGTLSNNTKHTNFVRFFQPNLGLGTGSNDTSEELGILLDKKFKVRATLYQRDSDIRWQCAGDLISNEHSLTMQ